MGLLREGLFEGRLVGLGCQGKTAIVWQCLFGQIVLSLEYLSVPVELFVQPFLWRCVWTWEGVCIRDV